MPLRSNAVHAISLEIGNVPKMAFLENASSVPTLPDAPTVWAIDFEWPDMPQSLPLERLIDAVAALTGHRSEPWMIEVHQPDAFVRGYHQMLESIHHADRVPILVYVPERSGKPVRLTAEALARTRSMLERLGPRLPHKRTQEPDTNGSPLEAARARRAQLLKEEQWLDGGKVHQQQGGAPDAPGSNNTASRLRRKEELLGAWDGREYLHPAFQFDPKTGRLMPEMKELLALLPKDRSGWRQVFWLFQPHAHLDGRRPADVFATDLKLVIEAAQSTFAPGDTNW